MKNIKVMNKQSAGIYIHIPFCVKRCKYCSFTSYKFNRDTADKYIEALFKEINLRKSELQNRSFSSIYIGGGTPTALDEKNLKKFAAITKSFNCNNSIEFTIEANPGTLTKNKLAILKNMGINRLSIGVQSFEPHLLKLLGRIHSVSEIYESFKLARYAGFNNINLDLIFAIPTQIKKEWEETLKKTIELNPEHISTYNLTYEQGTILYKQLNEKKIAQLDSDIEFSMYRHTINFFKKHGFNQYEISNFAKTGKQCRHNLTYWQNREYLGFGAGSVSYFNSTRYSNTKNISHYLKKIDVEQLPIVDKENITNEKKIKEAIMLGLRLTRGLSKKEFIKRFGKDIEDLYKETINNLTKKSLIKSNGNYLKLTKRGVYLNNDVLVEFM